MKLNKQQLKELIKEELLQEQEETIEDKFFTCEDGESAGYWAGQLHKTMDQAGTDEERFVKIAKMKCAGQIKLKFDDRFDESLEEWIKDDFFGTLSSEEDRKIGTWAIKRFNALGEAAQKMLDGLKLGDEKLKEISGELDELDVIGKMKKAEEFEEELSASNKVSDILATAMGDKNFPYKKEYSDSEVGDVLKLAKKIQTTVKGLMKIYELGAGYSEISEKIRVGLLRSADLAAAPKEKGDAVNESMLYEEDSWGVDWDKIKREREAKEKEERDAEEKAEREAEEAKEKTERYETLAIDAERLVKVFEQKLKLLKKYYSRIAGINKRAGKGTAAKGSQAADGTGPGGWGTAGDETESGAAKVSPQEKKLNNLVSNLLDKVNSGNASADEMDVYHIIKKVL